MTSDRVGRERQFHEEWASAIDTGSLDVVACFEGSTAPENRFIVSRMGDVRGKRLLDLGCGAGENSVYFALKGAHCVAADCTNGMVEAAGRLAQQYGVTVEGRVVDAMKMDFPSESFDIVYAANLLHHVDIDKALVEIHRVLKPGGMFCAWDPLRHNPVINIYRRIATNVRTRDEHPLSIHAIRQVRDLFVSVEYDTFWLATLWIFLRFYLIERVDPNKERYWKKIIREESRLRSTYYRLEPVDRMLKKLPFMSRMAWNVAFVARKQA